MAPERIIIVGTGAFGLSAGRELARRGHDVIMVDPTGPTPHALSSSRDISKVVRSEYWDDADYTRMGEESIERWLQLNAEWGDRVYHNVGVALLAPDMTETSYEGRSLATARAMDKPAAQLDAAGIRERFPMFRPGAFNAGYFNPRGGYVEALRALRHLRDDLICLGAVWHLGRTVTALDTSRNTCQGVVLDDGTRLAADHILLATGAWTGLLVPQLQPHAQPTGQPIFHLAVTDWPRYSPPHFSVILADIENTGQYILPLHPVEKVIKVGLHTRGREVHPVQGNRMVQKREVRLLRKFQKACIPELARAPIVDSRICLYHDTRDHHFWIDRHPELCNLTVACGGSGHAFKFTPLLGDIIADTVEGIPHRYAAKFRWRQIAEPASDARPRLEDL